MKNTDIDVILFDLGGVLIELAGVEKMLEWSKGLGSTDELWRRWLQSGAVRAFETGRIGSDEFAVGVIEEFALPVAPAEFLAAFHGWPRALFPGAHALLAELAPHYRLASVSNTNTMHWARFTGEWALDQSFHHNFPSHRVGKLKPDAEYFEHVLDAVGAPAARVLFIDDNAINVDAAGRVGLVTRRVLGVDGARSALRELGLLPPM
jgi:HAD superfamily hydrolase (TIGR01509 family)